VRQGSRKRAAHVFCGIKNLRLFAWRGEILFLKRRTINAGRYAVGARVVHAASTTAAGSNRGFALGFSKGFIAAPHHRVRAPFSP